MKQIFGSALRQPWALVKWGGNQPNGRRPSTTVAYLTDPIKDEAGAIVGYEGGLVEFYRSKLEYHPSWHFRYAKARRFAASDVCEFFATAGKSSLDGPLQSQIRAAKKRVPVNEEQP